MSAPDYARYTVPKILLAFTEASTDVKTCAFNLLVESSSQFGQSENQKCSRRLSEEGNRETGSTLSWLAHIFTRPGPIAVIPTVPPLYHIRELASPTRPILRREMALPPIVQRRPGFSKPAE